MKAKKKALFLSGVAITLIAVYIFAALGMSDARAGKLFPLELGTYKMIAISYPNRGGLLILDSDSANWTLSYPQEIKYDTARANGLALAIASLAAEKEITPVGSLEQYGLDAPVEFRVFMPLPGTDHCDINSKEAFRFLIGSKTPGDESYYFSVNDRVYTMTAARAEALLLNEANILDTNVLNLNRSTRPRDIAANITRVRLYEGEELLLDAAPSGDDRAATLADALARTTAYEFVLGELQEYGVDSPRYTIEFDNENGTTSLYIGNKASDAEVYALTEGSKYAFTISSRGLWFIE